MSDSLSSIKGLSELEVYHNNIVNMSSKLPELTTKIEGVTKDTSGKLGSFFRGISEGFSNFVGSFGGKMALGVVGAVALCAGVFVVTKGAKND